MKKDPVPSQSPIWDVNSKTQDNLCSGRYAFPGILELDRLYKDDKLSSEMDGMAAIVKNGKEMSDLFFDDDIRHHNFINMRTQVFMVRTKLLVALDPVNIIPIIRIVEAHIRTWYEENYKLLIETAGLARKIIRPSIKVLASVGAQKNTGDENLFYVFLVWPPETQDECRYIIYADNSIDGIVITEYPDVLKRLGISNRINAPANIIAGSERLTLIYQKIQETAESENSSQEDQEETKPGRGIEMSSEQSNIIEKMNLFLFTQYPGNFVIGPNGFAYPVNAGGYPKFMEGIALDFPSCQPKK